MGGDNRGGRDGRTEVAEVGTTVGARRRGRNEDLRGSRGGRGGGGGATFEEGKYQERGEEKR